jgi:hypothetical protein
MKTLREMMDQLDEISRRDLLKGAGIAAASGATGVGVGVRKIADNRAAEKLGQIYGLLDNLTDISVPGAYDLKQTTYNFLDQYEKRLPNLRAKDLVGDDWYKTGKQDSQYEFRQEFPNGVQTQEDLKKFRIILTVHVQDFIKLVHGHPSSSFKEDQIEEASPDAMSKIDELFGK